LKAAFFIKNNNFKLAAIFGVTAILSGILFSFIDDYTATLIVRDRWQSLDPLFDQQNVWGGFTHKHGPHRMGLSYFLFKLNANWSYWDSRWDMFTQGIFYVLCTLMALRLKFLIFKRWDWVDISIPMIFITLQAALTISFNPYVHGLIPFMALAIALSYFIKNSYLKAGSISILCFASVFTGFSLVVCLAVIVIESISLLKGLSNKPASSIIIMSGIIGLALFFVSESSTNPLSKAIPSLSYIAEYGMLLTFNFLFFDVNPHHYWVALLIFLAVLPLIIIYGLQAIEKLTKENKTILLLAGSSFIFIVLNFYGRSDIGLPNALTSRYVPATMPMVFAFYLIILKIRPGWLRYIYLGGFLMIITRFQLKDETRKYAVVNEYHKVVALEKCLLENHSYTHCSKATDYSIHPKPEYARIQEKLGYLKRNKLNIYREN